MKNILIVANGVIARHFLERLFVTKSTHHYTIITNDDELSKDVNLENFTFYHFDSTKHPCR